MDIVKSDLTVIGAGPAGMCAAIAAARRGLKVALVHSRPVPGGNASSEVAVSINGAAANGNGPSVYARETGVIEEIKMKILSLNQTRLHNHSVKDWPMVDAAFLDMLSAEPNIDLYLNTTAYDVAMEGDRIASVFALQTGSERSFRFDSPLFSDCTGDGTVAFKSGAGFMWGEEGRDAYGESLAPPEATGYVMGSTLLLFTRDAGMPVRYTKPSFAYDVTQQPFWKNVKRALHRGIVRNDKLFNGYWWIEVGGLRDVIGDNESITWELRKIVYGLWDYIKNSGDFQDVDTLLLDKVTTFAGKRESRRFIGDYVLSQPDIDEKRDFFDAVGTGGWTMDVHAQDGLYDPREATFWHFVPGMYNFPYRVLYAKDIGNLFLGGRLISATHVAMSSTRIMCTCAVGGQAIGTAASLCIAGGVMPRDVTERHMDALQAALVADDQTIVGISDGQGVSLLEGAKISASSTKAYVNELDGKPQPLEADTCLALPCAERIDSVEIGIVNGSEPQVLTVEVYTGRRPENYIPEVHVKTFAVEVAPGFEGYLPLPVDAAHQGDHKLYLNFKANPALSLVANQRRYTGFVTFLSRTNQEREKYPKSGHLLLHRIKPNLCFRNVAPETSLYAADNLLNGVTRPYGLPNAWISQEAAGASQRLVLDLARPTDIGAFTLFFDTCLEEDNFRAINPCFIKRYTVTAASAEGTFEETLDGCVGRRFVHRVAKRGVTQITITLEETHGADYFSMFGVKAEAL